MRFDQSALQHGSYARRSTRARWLGVGLGFGGVAVMAIAVVGWLFAGLTHAYGSEAVMFLLLAFGLVALVGFLTSFESQASAGSVLVDEAGVTFAPGSKGEWSQKWVDPRFCLSFYVRPSKGGAEDDPFEVISAFDRGSRDHSLVTTEAYRGILRAAKEAGLAVAEGTPVRGRDTYTKVVPK